MSEDASEIMVEIDFLSRIYTDSSFCKNKIDISANYFFLPVFFANFLKFSEKCYLLF